MEKRDIPGFEGFYQADDEGHIWSVARRVKSTRHKSGWKSVRERRLIGCDNGRGYLEVTLYREGRIVKAKIHHLVAATFHGPWPEGAECVRHRDDNRTRNEPGNLVYGTIAENVADSIHLGTFTRGELNGTAKFTNDEVALIKRRLLDGAKTGSIAKEHGVAWPTICDIKAGRNWAHIEPARAA